MNYRDRLPREPTTRGWHIVITSEVQLDMLRLLIEKYPGDVPVMLHADGRMRRLKPRLALSGRLNETLIALFGAENIKFGGGFQEFRLRT
jgi:hypothetical protein